MYFYNILIRCNARGVSFFIYLYGYAGVSTVLLYGLDLVVLLSICSLYSCMYFVLRQVGCAPNLNCSNSHVLKSKKMEMVSLHQTPSDYVK